MSSSPRPFRLPRTVLGALAVVAALALGTIALTSIPTRPADGVAAVPAAPVPSRAQPRSPPAVPAPQADVPAPRRPQQLAFAPSPDGKGPPVPLPPSGIAYNPNPAAPRASGAAPPALTRLMPSRARSVVTAAIEAQVPALAACFASDGASPAPRAVNRRALWSGMGGRGVLRLTLEPRAGELLIHDAAVERQGRATTAELACAQRALRGTALDLPDAAPGARITMLYPIR